MPDGKFILPEPETVSMSGDAARRLIGCGSGDAALLYIYILQSGGVFSAEDAARRTGRSAEQIESALAVLRRLGLIREDSSEIKSLAPADEMPDYTREDIKHELENGASFRMLVQEVQKILGKVLSSGDLLKLFGMYDHLGLPPEVILFLVTHCLTEYEKRYGKGRRPTMRYIEKAAFYWEREGIYSIEAAESYLKRYEEIRTVSGNIKDAIQIRGRDLTPSEQRYVDGWIDMGLGTELIAEAYDRTVFKTGKLAWNYMDSILKSWHSKGFKTLADIENGDRISPHANTKTGGKPAPTASDMEHMKHVLDRIKGGS